MRSLQLSLEECLASESDLADSVDLQTFSSLQLCSFDIENGRRKLVSAVRLKFWTQFLEQFWDPLDSTVGSSFGLNLGLRFLGPIFGPQFWDPALDSFLGPNFLSIFGSSFWPKIRILGASFWVQIWVCFWGPEFGFSYIFNRGPFLVPIFGVQIWTQIWPPKFTKNVKKVPRSGVPRRGARFGTPKCSENCQIWHTKITRSSQTGSTSSSQTEPNMTSNLVP